MRITFNIPEFTRNERNSHCDVLHITPLESPDSSWMTRSQRSRRRDKGLCMIACRGELWWSVFVHVLSECMCVYGVCNLDSRDIRAEPPSAT